MTNEATSIDGILRELRVLAEAADWEKRKQTQRRPLLDVSILTRHADIETVYPWSKTSAVIIGREQLTQADVCNAATVRGLLRHLKRRGATGFAELRGQYALFLHPDVLCDFLGDELVEAALGMRNFDRAVWMDGVEGAVGSWMGFVLIESLDLPILGNRTTSGDQVYTSYAVAASALDAERRVVLDRTHVVRLESGATP